MRYLFIVLFLVGCSTPDANIMKTLDKEGSYTIRSAKSCTTHHTGYGGFYRFDPFCFEDEHK